MIGARAGAGPGRPLVDPRPRGAGSAMKGRWWPQSSGRRPRSRSSSRRGPVGTSTPRCRRRARSGSLPGPRRRARSGSLPGPRRELVGVAAFRRPARSRPSARWPPASAGSDDATDGPPVDLGASHHRLTPLLSGVVKRLAMLSGVPVGKVRLVETAARALNQVKLRALGRRRVKRQATLTSSALLARLPTAGSPRVARRGVPSAEAAGLCWIVGRLSRRSRPLGYEAAMAAGACC